MLRTTLTLSAVSTRFYRVPVSDTVNGTVLVDPTGDEVSFAFMAPGVNPDTANWVSGLWETIGTTFYAKVLLGPGGNALAVGTYLVWIWVADSPEAPKEIVGALRVT